MKCKGGMCMRWFRLLKGKTDEKKKLDELRPPQMRGAMSCCYQENIAYLKKVFQDDDPIEFREVSAGANGDIRACFTSPIFFLILRTIRVTLPTIFRFRFFGICSKSAA